MGKRIGQALGVAALAALAVAAATATGSDVEAAASCTAHKITFTSPDKGQGRCWGYGRARLIYQCRNAYGDLNSTTAGGWWTIDGQGDIYVTCPYTFPFIHAVWAQTQ
jgi:hypothetical protein